MAQEELEHARGGVLVDGEIEKRDRDARRHLQSGEQLVRYHRERERERDRERER